MLCFAIYWSLSLAMAVILLVIAIYYFSLHRSIYKASNRLENSGNSIDSMERIQMAISDDRENYKEILLDSRSSVWKRLYLCFIIFFVLSYLSRFFSFFLKKVISANTDFDLTELQGQYFALVIGIFHKEVSETCSFARDSAGYFTLFVLLLLERRAEQWYFNKMGIESVSIFSEKQRASEESSLHCIPANQLIRDNEQELGVNQQQVAGN